MKLEVVTLSVSDVDRAKRFYQSLGWRLDADFLVGEEIRVVQFTPPRSNASISFGTGLTTAEPGSAQRFELVVSDIEAARDDLISRSTSFTFLTLPGHFRGPGRTIRFTTLGRGGRLILRQLGATSPRISDLAYDGGAWLSWRTQAATLRAVISPEGARRPGARAGAPSS